MQVTNRIDDFIVHQDAPLLRCLNQLNVNQRRILFVLDDERRLLGSFSDGDFRRWVTTATHYDFEATRVSEVMNPTPVQAPVSAQRKQVRALFAGAIDAIPLVDPGRRLVSIAFQNDEGLDIAGHRIAAGAPAFVIAEIGNNHNGSIELAQRLVDLAREAGADCAKFQMRNMQALYRHGSSTHGADLGAQYTLDLLSRNQLANEQLLEVFDYCKQRGITPLCTPWDIPSLQVLEDYGMPAYKVASADLTNTQILQALADTGKPLICSTGMSTEAEIRGAASFLRQRGAEAVFLHCNSTYPAPFKDVNLAYLPRLQSIVDGPVGYSGHERGVAVAVAAVSLGARVIEKHFTVDKEMEGNDHKVSLLPDEFRSMVRMIREVEESMGSAGERSLSQGELINRETLAKSLVATRPIEAGQTITREMVDVKSPGQGLQPCYLDVLLGRIARRNMVAGDFFFPSDLRDAVNQVRPYRFERPFGIPVRFHDYRALASKTNLDFVEFHLSYMDLELRPADFIEGPQSIGLAVHSPELFAGDHIMDLATEDEAHRHQSIAELERVCDMTRGLKALFPKTQRPVIVINAGGFDAQGFRPAASRAPMYARVADALRHVDQSGIEIIIQTMPPFPWHFGGQSHHNLFVAADEIDRFCREHGYRICYDVSHSMMACNYYAWQLSSFTRAVARHIAHMHIADAKGTDGEGVQIGHGDVDFTRLAQDLGRDAPNAQFIPEIWQGHKNGGEGFWEALEFLERRF